MAGDWIKMRGNLWDDPRVAKLCDLTDQSEAAIVGSLYWLWATADQHTEDGCMPGLTMRQIDRKTGVAGFAAALVAIGWLRDDPQGVVIVGFKEHNGESAKKRCQTAKRVAAFKAKNAPVTQEAADGNAASVTTPLAERDLEKEKRREEKKEEVVERVEPEPAPDLSGFSPTEAGLACRAMREAGMAAVNPGDPRLTALLRQGATVEELAGIAVEAAGKGKGFAWALKALEGRRTDAAAITPLAPRVAARNGETEPEWRRVQRERHEAFAGRFAASKAQKPATDGVVNVAARIVGE